MLKSINVKATWECDICHEWSHNLELQVSVDGKKFNRDGWDAIDDLLEERRNDRSHRGRDVVITKNNEWLDVCQHCAYEMGLYDGK